MQELPWRVLVTGATGLAGSHTVRALLEAGHAARAFVRSLGKAPETLIETNVAGVRNVIGTALDLGIEYILHVSSLATLFRGDDTPLSESSEPQDSKHA